MCSHALCSGRTRVVRAGRPATVVHELACDSCGKALRELGSSALSTPRLFARGGIMRVLPGPGSSGPVLLP